MSRHVAFSLVLLLAVLDLGLCLQCYQCNSQSNPECNDPFTDKNFLTDCSTQDSVNFNRRYLLQVFPTIQDGVPGTRRYCHKIVLQTGTIVRTCLDANPAELNYTCKLLDSISKVTPTDVSKQLKHCSVCDKDKCNGAFSIAPSLPLAILTAVIAYLFYKQ